MSGDNGTARKKSAARETRSDAAEELLQQYADLMRQAGSPNGAWNPDPDEQTLGILRDDVEISPNEIKFLFLVKSCCLRQKPAGRTAWGFTETGKPLRDTEVSAFFGWDPANTMKWSKRLLAWGFIRKNTSGQYGIGARVQGKFVPPKPQPGTPSEVDLLVCTDKLPRYLAEAACSQLTESEKLSFLQGWRRIKSEYQQKLNAEKQRIYEQEQNHLDEHCKAFSGKLPGLKRKGSKAPEEEAADPDSDLSVQTSSVQNGEEPLYSAPDGSVRTTYIRKQSKASSPAPSPPSVSGSPRASSSSSSSEPGAKPTTTTETPSAEERKIAAAIGRHEILADDVQVRRILAACRAADPECTPEEIEHFVDLKAPASKQAEKPAAYLCASVANCFQSEEWRAYRKHGPPAAADDSQPQDPAARITQLRFLIDDLPRHPQIENWRKELAELERQAGPGERAQKAGQR
jgi:hypothetical protein